MAYMAYDHDSATGGKLLSDAVDLIIRAKQLLLQAYVVAGTTTSYGANGAALETDQDFHVATGKGAALWSALVAMRTNLDNVTELALADLQRIDSGQ